LIAYFLSNISAKYYENPTMLLRVIAENIGDVIFETQCTLHISDIKKLGQCDLVFSI